MSLVAYTASDESDESDTEENVNTLTESTVKPPVSTCSTSADVDHVLSASKLQPPNESPPADSNITKQNGPDRLTEGHISDSDSESEQMHNIENNENEAAKINVIDSLYTNGTDEDVGSLLKALPQPRESSQKTVDVSAEDEDELEEEVKPKLSQLQDAPKPPPKTTKVKITIPVLQEDSDEEEQQVKKKPKLSTGSGKSGLTSLLPAPMHMSKKESNRVLLPYSLSKKMADRASAKNATQTPAVAKEAKSRSAGDGSSVINSVNKFTGISGYGSDSDDSGTEDSTSNFFSLSESTDDSNVQGPVLPEPPPANKSKMSLPPPKLSDKSERNTESTTEHDDSGRLSLTDSENLESTVLINQDAPLDFKKVDQDAPLSFQPRSWSTVHQGYSSRQYTSYSSDENINYPQPESSDVNYSQLQYENYLPEPGDVQELVQDEEFLRIQGKKQRGKEEINIVDINADDYISTAELQKNLTQETEHVSSHKKKDGPTSQQKRKHQIHFLAHQAKERELELKNQWSQNRMTKRQTQAKYGF